MKTKKIQNLICSKNYEKNKRDVDLNDSTDSDRHSSKGYK
jgi:hypothetical protein